MARGLRWFGHGLAIVLLTALTQVGGLAWAASLWFRRRWISFALLYALLWGTAVAVAPMAGRVALPCFGEPLRMQSPGYCLTLRHFVTPELAQVASSAASEVAQAHPGTVTLALDGSFPFGDGFPLLPHLSHDDGEKLDLAFFYTDPDGVPLVGKTRSPIGYWAFETLDHPICPKAWPTMRWDFAWAQEWLPDRPLDQHRTADLIRALIKDPRVAKIFVEPPLAEQLGVSDPKLRFQGCRAARHDDHIHLQL